jgi:hypothetical protein
LAIVVPAWSLALVFVAGLAAGVVACRLVMGRARPEAPAALSAPEPEPAAVAVAEADADGAAVAVAPEPAAEAAAPAAEEPEPAGAAASAGAAAGESEEDPAAAVDDVVAELERRVKGRRTDGEADRTTARRRERGD